MAETKAAFTLVSDDVLEASAPAPPPKNPADHKAALQLIMLGIATLSKRMVVAVADLFTLGTVASAFWLWHAIPDPNPYQLIELALYAVFVVAVNIIVRRG